LRRKLFITIILIFFLFSFQVSSYAEAGLSMSLRDHLVVIEDNEGEFPEDNHVKFYREIFDYYNSRYYKPIWIEDGQLKTKHKKLIDEIERSYEEGLNPRDYHLEILEGLIKSSSASENNTSQNALLDIYLTDAFLKLASDYITGKLNSQFISSYDNISEDIQDDKINLDGIFSKLDNSNNLSQVLKSYLPISKEYLKLKEKLYLYRDSGRIKKWKQLKKGELLAIKASGSRVKELIDNLNARRYLSKDEIGRNDYFDSRVKNAVIEFQTDNGLKADGIVGDKTVSELNIPLNKRIEQIILNLERWRWLPKSIGDRYIYVNIADYRLDVFEDDSLIMSMKTIVGRSQRSTPVFSDQIEYLVFNPYWYVPKKIALEDKLHLIKEDPAYIEENNYELLQYSDENRLTAVDHNDINWAGINEDNFNYILRQKPGKENALGRVKFMFPNKFSVYLHDTPSKYLFSENQREFSSGCIRIEKPFELAKYLLKDNKDFESAKIDEILLEQKNELIYLKRKMPIYIQYITAWVDESDDLNFRRDIYNRDKMLKNLYF